MRTTQYFLSTLKKTSKQIETISHELMLRSGMIRQLSSGIYVWMPIGLLVIKKVEKIIRKEMNKIGFIELFLPLIQPVDLWKKSKRIESFGSELINFYDRNKHHFLLGPTHEELITNIMCNELRSYKQLPINLFQINIKFRDEIRPRFGVIRSREFLMKDAYSFHVSLECLRKSYKKMYLAYDKIFSSLSLNYCVIEADNGVIGGTISHEFHAFVKNGENDIATFTESTDACNVDSVKISLKQKKQTKITSKMTLIELMSNQSIIDLIKIYKISIKNLIKTFFVKANDKHNKFILILLRSDHEISKYKLEKIHTIYSPLTFIDEDIILKNLQISNKLIGPINFKLPIIADYAVIQMNNFVIMSNKKNKYYINVNWERDLIVPQLADIRKVNNGDFSSAGKGIIKIKKGLEIGHIFQIGNKYSKLFKLSVQDKNGCKKILMGSYGIGITRLIAAIIEQNHDKNGIIWPINIAPFTVAIIPVNMYHCSVVKKAAEDLYNLLCFNKIEVLFDDREERLGVLFKDIDLIGIPYCIIIGEKNILLNKVECKIRSSNKLIVINYNSVLNFLNEQLKT